MIAASRIQAGAARHVLRIAWYWAPVVVIAAVISGLSSVSGSALAVDLFRGADKVAHATEFGVLAFLFVRALARTTSLRGARLVAVTLAMVALYAILDETHQAFVPQRDVDPFDAVADFVGGLGACGLWLGVDNRRKGGSKS